MNVKGILLLITLFVSFQHTLLGQTPLDQNKEIPPITFCEMVARPELYFDQTIRITATFEIRTEGSTLNDAVCPRSHDDQIGVSAVKINERQIRLLNRDFQRIRAGKKGIHPRVSAVGILRNVSRRSFDWYRYRFDIIRFESIDQEISQTNIAFDGAPRFGQSSSERVAAIDFCDLVKHPRRYFDQTVRIQATWASGDEFSYLSDDRCPAKITHDIAVRFVNDEAQRELIKPRDDSGCRNPAQPRQVLRILSLSL